MCRCSSKWTRIPGEVLVLSFNPAKCTVFCSHCSPKPFIIPLFPMRRNSVRVFRSLVTWQSHQQCSIHVFVEKTVNAVSQKANNTINFIMQNRKDCPQEAKGIAYNSLSTVLSSIVHPYRNPITPKTLTKSSESTRGLQDLLLVTTVQAAAMFSQLGWSTLEDSHQKLQITLMFKIIKQLIPYHPHLIWTL